MEKAEQIKIFKEIFTLLMRRTVSTNFSLPKGGIAQRNIEACVDVLTKEYGELGGERIVDFCVCQVYVLCDYGKEYLARWQVSHSFGKKALERFKSNDKRIYFQNKWLNSYDLEREKLYRIAKNQGKHPYSIFIFPEYEERTKFRMLSSEVGYYICGTSTLLWTPYSRACQECINAEKCRDRTQKLYPEIYRIRIESYKAKRL